MTRIASLNVGHQTWARPIPGRVRTALLDQQPDILVLVEYVEGDGRPDLRDAVAAAGLQHTATSAQVQRQGRSVDRRHQGGVNPCEGSVITDQYGRSCGVEGPFDVARWCAVVHR